MSPAATITDEDALAAALDAADRLFYARGVVAVSMAEIRDESAVSLRRLYALFPSKSDLVAGWLKHRHQTWLADFTNEVEQRLAKGVDPVDAIFTSLAAWMSATNFRGCGFINTHAESSELTDDHRTIIRNHKRALAAYLSTLDLAGEALAVLVDGAIVQASIFASTEPIDHARRAAYAIAGTTPTQEHP